MAIIPNKILANTVRVVGVLFFTEGQLTLLGAQLQSRVY